MTETISTWNSSTLVFIRFPVKLVERIRFKIKAFSLK